MGKEIVINAEKEQTRIAIVEDGTLAELYVETTEHERTLGDIFLGRVRRIMPSIQAAFVDIGQKQDAFLHFSDLAENLAELLAFVDQDNPKVAGPVHSGDHPRGKGKRRHPRHGRPSKGDDGKKDGDGKPHVARASQRKGRRSAQRRSTRGDGKHDDRNGPRRGSRRGPRRGSSDLLQRGQRVLVKIVKEPISNKGSRVSTNISLAGRFMVLVPLADYTAVSKKITSHKERRRLRALAKMLVPEGFGVIVRTVAEGKDAKSLDTDLRLLLEKWRKIERKLQGKPDGPMQVHEDVNMASSIIRDLFSNDYDRILVDNPRLHRNIKNYIQAVAPQMSKAVQLHKEGRHIFEANGLMKAIEEVFSERVELPSGGYLFIERTEAMHVVDVNSGRSGRGMDQEDSSLKVNIEAARAIAHQVRLRDLGGIIVIDFIDMREERNKRKVFDELRNQFRTDRAVTKILPMSDFGLMQITRQRLRPSLTTTFSASDAGVNGAENGKPDTKPNGKNGGGRQNPRHQDRGRRDDKGRHQDKGRSHDKGRRDDRTVAAEDRAAPEAPPGAEKHEDGRDGRGRRQGRGGGRRTAKKPSELIEEMETWVLGYKQRGNRGPVELHVHPFTAAYLNKKVPNHPTRWFLKHRLRIRLETDPSLDPLGYRFIDLRTGEDVTGAGRPGGRGRDSQPEKAG